jgi:hypothetical protein
MRRPTRLILTISLIAISLLSAAFDAVELWAASTLVWLPLYFASANLELHLAHVRTMCAKAARLSGQKRSTPARSPEQAVPSASAYHLTRVQAFGLRKPSNSNAQRRAS